MAIAYSEIYNIYFYTCNNRCIKITLLLERLIQRLSRIFSLRGKGKSGDSISCYAFDLPDALTEKRLFPFTPLCPQTN